MKISVVIPAFNVERWVRSAIESALRQEPPPDEVIVVDDGSRDSTAEAAAEYEDVRLVRQDHRGPSAARNAGAVAARGDALFFLDADDALLPVAFSHLLEVARRWGDWAAILPSHLPIGSRATFRRSPSLQEERLLGRRHVAGVLRANPLAANALVRRDVWRRHPFSEDLPAAEDLEFWLRLLLSGEKLVLLARPLVRWRSRRPGGLTGNRSLMRASRRLVFEWMVARDDLTIPERLVVAYQLVRTAVGEGAARRAAGDPYPREGLARSPKLLVRATGAALAVPGLLPTIAWVDEWSGPREARSAPGAMSTGSPPPPLPGQRRLRTPTS